jgi:hypothetical protein
MVEVYGWLPLSIKIWLLAKLLCEYAVSGERSYTWGKREFVTNFRQVQ